MKRIRPLCEVKNSGRLIEKKFPRKEVKKSFLQKENRVEMGKGLVVVESLGLRQKIAQDMMI